MMILVAATLLALLALAGCQKTIHEANAPTATATATAGAFTLHAA
jgi:hypothetical protein